MPVTGSAILPAAWGPPAFLPVTLSMTLSISVCAYLPSVYPSDDLSVQIFSLFKTGWLFSYCSVLRVFNEFWIRLSSNIWFTNIVSQPIICLLVLFYNFFGLFILLTVSFTDTFDKLIKSNLSGFFFSWISVLVSCFRNALTNRRSWRFSMFSSRTFYSFRFRSITHFKLILVYCVKFRTRFPFLSHSLLVVPAPFVEKTVLSPVNCSAPLSKSIDYLRGFISGLSILFHWSMCPLLWPHYTLD